MSFRTVSCVTGVNDSNDALAQEILLCRESGFHLSVLVIGITPPLPIIYTLGTLSGSGWSEDYAARNVAVLKRVEVVEKQLQLADISADVSVSYSEYFRIDKVVGESARYADVMLIGANLDRDEKFRQKIIYGALLYSAKPLMLCSRAGLHSFNAKRILIAWDSGLPVSRAINHALWQMKDADAVHIVIVDPIASTNEGQSEQGTDLAQYLSRHGLKVRIEQLASGGRSVARVIGQHAFDMNADLVVMGAYSHSHLHQLIFGSTTSALLEELDVAVLMAR